MPPRARTTAAKSSDVIEGEVVAKSDEQVQEWGAATLNGRQIAFNPPSPAQLIVLRRLLRQAEHTKTEQERFGLVAKILDAVSALIVTDEDRDWADQEVLDGRADLEDMTPLIIAAIGGKGALEKWQSTRDAPKPRRVRRARS